MYELLLFRIIFFNTSRKYYLTERHKNQHASLCNIIIIVERFCTYISCSFEYQKPDKKRCPRQYKKFMVHENNSLCRKMLRRTYTCLYPSILPFDNTPFFIPYIMINANAGDQKIYRNRHGFTYFCIGYESLFNYVVAN